MCSKLGPPGGKEAVYLDTTKKDQDKNFQEIEAQNRWKVLEAHAPSYGISTLKSRMDLMHEHEKPPMFYNHEGKYNEERAGLYKTSYSPERLAYSMNSLDVSGPEISNTRQSHLNALTLPTRLNHDMKDAFRYSRTLSSSQPNLSGDRRESRELVNQHQVLKQAQKLHLQPNAENARVKIQEKETILKESTMGDSYNTQKFLQEWDISKFARNEPLQVMSHENQNLHNVRKASSSKSKSVSFSDNVMVAQSLDSGVLRYSSAPTRGSQRVTFAPTQEIAPAVEVTSQSDPVVTTQYSSVQAQYLPENDKFEEEKAQQPFQKVKFTNIETEPSNAGSTEIEPKPFIAYSNVLRKRPATSDPSSEYRNEFSSKGTNFIPSNLENSISFESAYKAQFPAHDIGYKRDARLDWQPGHGMPRPQTSLLNIQNRFEKSSVRRSFLSQFSESNPDLRDNITKGKKHNFYGLSGQIIHG